MPFRFLLVKNKKPTTETLFEKIKEDKRIKKLFAMKETGVYAIDTSGDLQEIHDLHLSRRFINIKTTEYLKSAQTRSIDWALELASYRGRCTTIKMRSFKVKRLLEEHIKNTQNYILSKYSDELKSYNNTISGRKALVDHVLEPFYKLSYKLDTVIMTADMVIEDLKQSGFSLRATVDILKLEFSKDNI